MTGDQWPPDQPMAGKNWGGVDQTHRRDRPDPFTRHYVPRSPATVPPPCRSGYTHRPMDDLVASLVSRAGGKDALDEHRFIVEQSKLDVASRAHVRRSAELAHLCFGLDGLDTTPVNSFYWDTTTLCMRRPLLEYVADGMRVLEIGPGPSGTMSLFLCKNRRGLRAVCAELNPDFVRSARQIAAANGVALDIVESDMVSALAGSQFDVVFMNPPYMKESVAPTLGIAQERDSAIWRASYGGESGCEILDRFLHDVPAVLAPAGVALLGINTWYLEDETIAERIGISRLSLTRRYYSEERVAPVGPYSQVYVLGKA